jgi:rubrerythrin
MSLLRTGAAFRNPAMVAILVTLALVLALAEAADGARHAASPPPASEITPQWTMSPDQPLLNDTATNLQQAFTNEMNACERYRAYARLADAEQHPDVARLFRACAEAESIHARRDVQAIAMTGQPARAVLDRISSGTTAQNLQVAIGGERYEVQVWYPALIERARQDRQSMAVRALTLALQTERGHLELLEAALANLPGKPLATAYFVCPYCGRTVRAIEYKKCPGCYTSSARFLKPA